MMETENVVEALGTITPEDLMNLMTLKGHKVPETS
jgi:hypothetical protein